MDLFSQNTPEIIHLDDASSIEYWPQFIAPNDADRIYHQLQNDLPWRQDEIHVYGRLCKIPRLQHYQAEQGADYAYSGLYLPAEPFHPNVDELRQQIQAKAQFTSNAVLLNYYRDGKDSMGWHSDDEASLGKHPIIASVSLGETRRFLLREKANHRNKVEIALAHGSLLLMKGETQSRWQHSVAKTASPIGGRINLTFRYIKGKPVTP